MQGQAGEPVKTQAGLHGLGGQALARACLAVCLSAFL